MGVGFIQQHLSINHVLAPLTFTNSICFGQTGSGKTTGYILPNIKERIEANHAVIVYDYKGTLHTRVKYLAKEANRLQDVVEIGTPWGERINLLDGALLKELEFWSNDISRDRRDYWDMAAFNLFQCIKGTLDVLYDFNNHYPNSTYESAKMFNTKSSFNKIFKHCNVLALKRLYNVLDGMVKYIKQELTGEEDKDCVLEYIFLKAMEYNALLETFAKLKVDEEDGVGNNGVLQGLRNILPNFALSPCLNGKNFGLSQLIESGKIIIVYVDSFGLSATRLLHLRIFNMLRHRMLVPKKEGLRGVSIFVDEAHKIVTAETMPEVSVCRESAFEYLMATQDRLLLDNVLGIDRTSGMLSNIVHQLSFANVNIPACKNLEPFAYRTLEDSKHANVFGVATPIFIEASVCEKIEVQYQQENHIFKQFVVYNNLTYQKIPSEELVDCYLSPDYSDSVKMLAYLIFIHNKQVVEVELYNSSITKQLSDGWVFDSDKEMVASKNNQSKNTSTKATSKELGTQEMTKRIEKLEQDIAKRLVEVNERTYKRIALSEEFVKNTEKTVKKICGEYENVIKELYREVNDRLNQSSIKTDQLRDMIVQMMESFMQTASKKH